MREDVALNVWKVMRGLVSSMCWLGVFLAPRTKRDVGEKLQKLHSQVVHRTVNCGLAVSVLYLQVTVGALSDCSMCHWTVQYSLPKNSWGWLVRYKSHRTRSVHRTMNSTCLVHHLGLSWNSAKIFVLWLDVPACHRMVRWDPRACVQLFIFYLFLKSSSNLFGYL
jgi:hypothetical protein